jgi:hypothetical protein
LAARQSRLRCARSNSRLLVIGMPAAEWTAQDSTEVLLNWASLGAATSSWNTGWADDQLKML